MAYLSKYSLLFFYILYFNSSLIFALIYYMNSVLLRTILLLPTFVVNLYLEKQRVKEGLSTVTEDRMNFGRKQRRNDYFHTVSRFLFLLCFH